MTDNSIISNSFTDPLHKGSKSRIEEDLPLIWKDAVKYAPSKILGMLMNLFLVPIYTNLLSPGQYGLYNVAISTLSFLCIIFSDWVGISGLRFFKEHSIKSDEKSYFSTLLFLLISNLVIMYSLAFFSFNYLTKIFKVPHHLLFLVLLLIIPVAIRALLFQILRAQIKPLSYTFVTVMNQFITIILAIYFIVYLHLEATSILLGMSISIVFSDLALLFFVRMGPYLNIQNVKSSILNNFYKYGIPIALSSLGMWIITQSNRYIMQYFKGSSFNGITAVGYNLTFSILMPLFAIITLAAIPRIINKYESGQDIKDTLTKLTGYYFIIFSPAILILSLLPQETVFFFSNSEYSEAFVLLPFLAISVFVFGLTEYTTLQYHLDKKTYINTIILLSSGLAGIILNILLIPKAGIIGLGIATLVSQLLYLGLSLVIRVKNLYWLPPFQTIKKCFISILICTGFILLVKPIFNQPNLYVFILKILGIVSIYSITLKLQFKKIKAD